MQWETDGVPCSVNCVKQTLTVHVQASIHKHMSYVPYSHQSCQRRRECSILPLQRWWLPNSINSRCELLCISACFLNTWLVSEEGRRKQRRKMCYFKESTMQVNEFHYIISFFLFPSVLPSFCNLHDESEFCSASLCNVPISVHLRLRY